MGTRRGWILEMGTDVAALVIALAALGLPCATGSFGKQIVAAAAHRG
jgi:hypothetical protein